MQTFLPYKNFRKCAEVLDNRRLNKQIVECQQILSCITGIYPYSTPENRGWINHPAVGMWRCFPYQLYRYMKFCHKEWIKRGNKRHKSYQYVKENIAPVLEKCEKPPFLDDEDFLESHRSNLLRKNPEHYEKFFEGRKDLPLIWPTKTNLAKETGV